MFNLVRNLVNKAAKALRSAASQAAGHKVKNPVSYAISHPFQTFASGVSQQRWIPQPARNFAAQAAARAAALARQREIARRKKQAEVNRAVSKNTVLTKRGVDKAVKWLRRVTSKYNVNYDGKNWSRLYTKSGTFKGKNTGGGLIGFGIKTLQGILDPDVAKAHNDWRTWYTTTPAGQKQKARDDFIRVRNEYETKAKKLAARNAKDHQPKGLFGLWNNLIGSSDRAKKKFAEDELKKLTGVQQRRYEKKLNKFLKWQAKHNATLNKKRFSSQAEWNAYQKTAKKEQQMIADLEYDRAATTGSARGYKAVSLAKPRSIGGKVGGWFDKYVTKPVAAFGGSVYKYTLGSGSKDIASFTTAPSRFVNTIGNLINKNRKIYTSDGKTVNRSKSGLSAWDASYKQRNFNIKPYNKKKFNLTAAKRRYGYATYSAEQRQAAWYGRGGISYEKWLKKQWDRDENYKKVGNNVGEFLADPLLVAGPLGKAGRSFGFLEKVSKVAEGASRLRRPAKWITSAANGVFDLKKAAKARADSNKIISWLGSERKTPNQKYSEAIESRNKNVRLIQNNYLTRINRLKKQIKQNPDADAEKLSRSLESLTDSEAMVLRRMRGGKFSVRDRLMLSGRGLAPVRQRLQEIANKIDEFSEQQIVPDKVIKTRFGRRKKLYLPNNVWLQRRDGNLNNYNFLRRQKRGVKTADELRGGLINRYFVSNVGDVNTAKLARSKKEHDQLVSRYLSDVAGEDALVEKAYRKTRTPFNRVRGGIEKWGPTALWKKGVLKYRPAWTVNNILYNTQANALASGGRGLLEQGKMLNPRYWRQAMDEIPKNVKTDLAKEIGGKGRINKFYSGVENWSRVAAYRSLKAKGYSDEAALKRVNKYLFDYSTKNIERPIRAVLPFYAWNKNLIRVAAQMPFDRPVASKVYNQIDQYQKNQFNGDFETMRPELRKQGYSDKEIDDFKQQLKKYFEGRLKVGDKYITTPFNAFSEKGLAGFGVNPLLQSFIESTTGLDNWGRPIKASEQGFGQRFLSKFPQFAIGKKFLESRAVSSGKVKPRSGWIGEKGSAGYGLTKEKQGFDKSKSNYDQRLDPRAKLGQDVAAFFGMPRPMKLDKKLFLKNKKYAKVAKDYFSTDWNKLEAKKGWAYMNKKRQQFFKAHGVTDTDFYEGILAKNDTANTKRIKQLKTDAANQNKKLFTEYSKQPYGTRSSWAANKLRQLNKQGYFDKNPFLKSFDWLNPKTIARADKASVVREALRTGDWSKYRALYGSSRGARGLSAKAIAYRKAKVSGDWSGYISKYGSKYPTSAKAKFWRAYMAEKSPARRREMLRENPQYAKWRPKSEAQIKEGKFWHKYASASPAARRLLLKQNPKYNRRGDWTDAQWDAWRLQEKRKQQKKLRTVNGFGSLLIKNKKQNLKKAAPVLERRLWQRRSLTKVNKI